jgi:hypothetical protein
VRAGASVPMQTELELRPADENIRIIQIRHIALGSMLYLIQLVATIKWISWIARVLANG